MLNASTYLLPCEAERDVHRKTCKIFWPLRINLNIEFSFKWLVANVLNPCIGCSSSYKITKKPGIPLWQSIRLPEGVRVGESVLTNWRLDSQTEACKLRKINSEQAQKNAVAACVSVYKRSAAATACSANHAGINNTQRLANLRCVELNR